MDTRSTGEVVASLIVNAQAMIAKEVELVGLELRRLVSRTFAGIAMLLVGALAAATVLLLGAVTAAVALEGSFDERWMAWGLVTLVVAAVALLLFVVAASVLARVWSLGATRRSVASTREWLRSLGQEVTGTPGGAEGRTSSGGDGR